MSETFVKVRYKYRAQGDDELSITKGQILQVLTKHDDGWWFGRNVETEEEGMFPHNYAIECDPPKKQESKESVPETPRRVQSIRLPKVTTSAKRIAVAHEVASKEETEAFIGGGEREHFEDVLPDQSRRAKPFGRQLFEAINLFGCLGDEPRSLSKGRDVKKLEFTLWAHNMGYFASVYLIAGGLFAWYWVSDDADSKSKEHSNAGLAVYGVFVGAMTALFEFFYGLKRPVGPWEAEGVPVRTLLQVIVAIPTLFAVPTILGGVMLMCAGVANFVANSRNEEGDQTAKKRRAKKKKRGASERDPFEMGETKSMNCCQRVAHMIGRLREADYLGQAVLSAVYWSINVFLFILYYVINLDLTDTLSGWVPPAKAFAGVLNFNMAIVIVPVTRTFLQWLNHEAESEESCCSWLKYLPLRKNIVFHKFIALVILFAAIGHVVCHLGNWAVASQATTNSFGDARIAIIWVTGVVMALSQFFLYTAAVDKVRRANFQIFWVNHHLFIVFLGFTIPHKPDWFFWFLIPAAMYCFEKVQRYRRGSRPVILKEVRFIDPVLELRFEPTGLKFKDGQYVFLCCPRLGRMEWHPFTISSPEGDLFDADSDAKFMSLHIKVIKGGWTENLKNYLERMNPKKSYPFVLKRRMGTEVVVGKTYGIDGIQLLQVDGPHAAPCQHYHEYNTTILVGAGIGITPGACILKSLLRYKWRKGSAPNELYFSWVNRWNQTPEYQWFILLLAQLFNKVAHDREKGFIRKEQKVQCHLFLTRFDPKKPAKDDDESWRLKQACIDAARQVDTSAKGGFSLRKLWKTVKNIPAPAGDVKSMRAAMASKGFGSKAAPNRVGDVWLWYGRPDWDPLFEYVVKNRPVKNKRYDIGCCFCGMTVIGKQLKKACLKHSDDSSEVYFHLHKENF